MNDLIIKYTIDSREVAEVMGKDQQEFIERHRGLKGDLGSKLNLEL